MGVREGSELCGVVRVGRDMDAEAMRQREEPTPFYQRREKEALPQPTWQVLFPLSHSSAMWGAGRPGRAGARTDSCRNAKSSVLLMETSSES